MPAKVADILRRAVLQGDSSSGTAGIAHAELLELRIAYLPYGPLAARIWEPRDNEVSCDARYVAAAESLDAPGATLDERLAVAPGQRCRFASRQA